MTTRTAKKGKARRVEALQARLATANQIIKNDCERESDTRKILARFDKSDSYCTYNSPMLAEEAMRALVTAEAERDAARDFIAQIVVTVHNHKAWTEAPALHDLCEQVLALTEEAGVRTKPTPGPGAGT